MAFPTALDSFTRWVDGTTIVEADPINQMQMAIEALEAKVGVNGSAVTTSHDYKLANMKLGTIQTLSQNGSGGLDAAQASTDGFLVCTLHQNYQDDRGVRVIGKSDSSSTPTTIKGYANTWTSRVGPETYTQSASFIFPVKKNDYYSAVRETAQSGGNYPSTYTIVYYWVPFGL
jgi:hypothetical protein